MQIPILNGIYADFNADFRTSYPRNMIPVPKENGIANGYLRPSEGIVQFGAGPGIGRGGINWGGRCYRVMGTKLVEITDSGDAVVLGDVGSGGRVSMDYSFDRLAIASGGKLFYWDGDTLVEVTDTDLGLVTDVLWIDGYFMTTDGESLVVTELSDPTSVNPLKYGSSESDPDEVVKLLKIRGEVYCVNRHTIEVFQNVGGELFPFARVSGALIPAGAVGTHAACVYMGTIAFVGGGRNDAPGVWIGSSGSAVKISTREIDQLLSDYTEAELSQIISEVRGTKTHQWLYIHLKNQTLVYDSPASQVAKEPVWFTLDSGLYEKAKYRAKDFVWCYDKWLCSDSDSEIHGYLTDSTSTQFGQPIGWEFGTSIMYNSGNGALFHEIELVALTGGLSLPPAAAGGDPSIWTSYTLDGLHWSQERQISAGKQGATVKRLAWLQQGSMRHWRIQKFRGTSDAHISVSRVEARIEALNA